jgi:hypothetical protein
MGYWAVVLVLWAVIEGNALLGKVNKAIETVRQVTVSGFVLTFVLLAAMAAFL